MLVKKPTEEMVRAAFSEYLKPGETVQQTAYGIQQPHLRLIIGLMLLCILPGLIAVAMLTKHYRVGLTNQRLIVLQTKNMKSLRVQSMLEYHLSDLQGLDVNTSVGPIFTHIKIKGGAQAFAAKFHRGYSIANRTASQGIAQAVAR